MAASSGGLSYSNVMTSTPTNYVIQVHLVRYEREISYNLSDVEKSELAFKKIGIPKGKLSYIDDSQFRRLDLYVNKDVPKTVLNLNTAFENREGLRTKPVTVKKKDQ